jgi:apolipoprotein D and lipocalin family protein
MKRFGWVFAAGGAFVAGVVAVAAAKQRKLTARMSTVPSVDLARYIGRWYEVARLPNEFQEECASDVTADYDLRADGNVDVVNRCRHYDGVTAVARGVARSVDPQTNARLQVRFAPALLSWFPMVWGDYWVIGLDEDYRWAVVGEPSRRYGWILSRTPQITATDWNLAVNILRENDYDPTRLIKTTQTGH